MRDEGPRYNPVLAQQCYALAVEMYKRRLGDGDLFAAQTAGGAGESKH
jgi:carboxymethylenebutenolidase